MISSPGGWCAPNEAIYPLNAPLTLPEVKVSRGGIKYVTIDKPKGYDEAIRRFAETRMARQAAAIDHACVEALILGLDVHLHREWGHAKWIGIELAERPPHEAPRIMPHVHEHANDHRWDEDEWD